MIELTEDGETGNLRGMTEPVSKPVLAGRLPDIRAAVEVLHPVTWFPPMWAFACGMVASGVPLDGRWWLVAVGVILAGPLACGTSQVVNDWFDRHVDAINEPDRPIPSGRLPGRWGLYQAILFSIVTLLVASFLGPWVLGASALGVALAWAYSAPPLRLKRNGWWGNTAVGFSYEGLAWVTGSALMLGGAMPSWQTLALAVLYSVGAHGIMTLNDFKSVEGDRQLGLRSLPVQLGVARAARLACWVMALPQVVVIALLLAWGHPWHAGGVAAVLVAQVLLMLRLLERPRELAPWYNATGITLYVSGMMISAWALRVAASG
jgi:chlorophyll synthase